MRHAIFCLVFSLGVAACETVPATMDQTVFDAEIAQVEANPSIASVDAALAQLLARTDLTDDQRLDALYLRASQRWEARYNLPGAIRDFDRALALRPEDARASRANRQKVFAATEIKNAQQRLARLQTLPDWFDDKVLMGDVDAAAERYRTSGLTPTDSQLYLLREAGFVCDGEGERVHQFGPEPEYALGAVWCSDPSLS